MSSQFGFFKHFLLDLPIKAYLITEQIKLLHRKNAATIQLRRRSYDRWNAS